MILLLPTHEAGDFAFGNRGLLPRIVMGLTLRRLIRKSIYILLPFTVPFGSALCGLSKPAAKPLSEAIPAAVVRYHELGNEGSPFHADLLRRQEIRSVENAKFETGDSRAVSLADGSAKALPACAAQPEIEFKVLLIIKRYSDTRHPLFLPVRAGMTAEEIDTARHCFEIQTPEMVREATGGRVKFTPAVIVSDKPLRSFEPSRRDSAEYMGDELRNELAAVTRPGEYDSAGYYFLHYDTASGYQAPRAGYGVGGYNDSVGMGMFAVSCSGIMNARDEIFLHEWMHGLEGYFGRKAGVRLPRGGLHGGSNYEARYSAAKAWRPQDSFKGYMEWYRDFLNGRVPEAEGFSGLGSVAWMHGPMRGEAKRRIFHYSRVDLPGTDYPGWVYALMKGDLTQAVLDPNELAGNPPSGPVVAEDTEWRLESWARAVTTTADYNNNAGCFTLQCREGDHASISRKLAIQPQTNYVFTAEVRTERVEIVQAGGRENVLLTAGASSSRKSFSGNCGWTRIVLPFTTKPDQKEVTLRLQMGGRGSLATGKAQFRDVRLHRAGYPVRDAPHDRR